MNDKQNAFVHEYLKDKNATQAAIRAGYSPRSAGQSAHRMMKDSEIKAAIDSGLEEAAENAQVTAEWVIERLMIEGEGKGPDTASSARVGALARLGDYLGVWAPEKRQVEVQGGLVLDLLGDEPDEG